MQVVESGQKEAPGPGYQSRGTVNRQGVDMPNTSRELAVFNFNADPVRVLDLAGDPWFYAGDVCEALGLTNVSLALKGLDEDEAGISSAYTRSANGVSQRREVSIVSESGLYALIFKSRRAEARTFQRWVTKEVLPAIRKTGSYTLPAKEEFAIRRAAWEAEDRIGDLEYSMTALEVDKNTRIAELEEKLDKAERTISALTCPHEKNEAGHCIHGRACTFVG